MNPAFQFLSGPAARPRIIHIRWQSCARFTADAGISLAVKRKVFDSLIGHGAGDLEPTPVSQKADLQQRPATGKLMPFDLVQALPGRRLLTPQSGEPEIKIVQRCHEWFHLS